MAEQQKKSNLKKKKIKEEEEDFTDGIQLIDDNTVGLFLINID